MKEESYHPFCGREEPGVVEDHIMADEDQEHPRKKPVPDAGEVRRPRLPVPLDEGERPRSASRIIAPEQARPRGMNRFGAGVLVAYDALGVELVLIIGFLVLIAGGTVLLLLPAATPADQPISFVDALFTSTSAVCVTGLAVRDTGTAFTTFGQTVILALIQLGGLGIMTVSAFFLVILRKRLTRRDASSLESVFDVERKGGIRRIVMGIIACTFLVEGIGALLLLPSVKEGGDGRALFEAVFHSISATCNAGFGLYPDSLVRFRSSLPVNLLIMALIVIGGIGFTVVFDLVGALRRLKTEKRLLSLHTRVVLATTAVLLVSGTAVFLLCEAHRTLEPLSQGERVLASAFQSVTLRTAGFSTLDFSEMQPATLFLVLLFMFIGGSPGSTAGGIKTTTFAIALATLWARSRGRESVVLFKRTIPEYLCTRALLIFILGFVVLSTAMVLLMLSEAHDLEGSHGREHFLDLLFEAVSAFGTVGLSTGWTPRLSEGGRIIIILLMFLGRVGPLTVAVAMGGRKKKPSATYPEGRVMIG